MCQGLVHKKDKVATKIAYVQENLLPQPIKLYTGMPVTPVTNSMSGICRMAAATLGSVTNNEKCSSSNELEIND